MENFVKNVPNIGISPQKEMAFLTYTGKFQDHTSKNFFQNGDFKYLFLFLFVCGGVCVCECKTANVIWKELLTTIRIKHDIDIFISPFEKQNIWHQMTNLLPISKMCLKMLFLYV